MYELLHEIPSDIVQVNQHETEKSRVAHIEDFQQRISIRQIVNNTIKMLE